LHLRLSPELYASVEKIAEETGLALNGSVRLLVGQGLAVYNGGQPPDQAENMASRLRVLADSVLACLIASEQTQLAVASILPEGRARIGSLLDEATNAAHDRLLRLEQAIRDEAGC
jgi:hypothetical protein